MVEQAGYLKSSKSESVVQRVINCLTDAMVNKELKPGDALYVPGRWAHRSINTGSEPLVMFFVYRGDAGHDYGTIEEKGYRKLVLEQDGKPVLVDNPKWKQG